MSRTRLEEVKFTEKEIEKLKMKMVKQFGTVSWTRLAKELNCTRNGIYNAIHGLGCYGIAKQVKIWLNN